MAVADQGTCGPDRQVAPHRVAPSVGLAGDRPSRAEARILLDGIEVTTIVGLRDRALIGLMIFSFARIVAVLGMKVGDVLHSRGASGCGCARKAVNGTPCRATTTLRPTSPRVIG